MKRYAGTILLAVVMGFGATEAQAASVDGAGVTFTGPPVSPCLACLDNGFTGPPVSVPDNGDTLILFGAALLGLVAVQRRLKAT
jgi:hypothetical protein